MNSDNANLPMCAGGCAAHLDLTAPSSGIARRTFLVQSGLLAAAAALAACGLGGDFTAPTLASGSSIKVSDYSALAAVGGVAMVTLSGANLAVVRTGSSTFVALSRVCPHQGGTVNQNGTGFLCPNHGAQFTANGTWAGGQRTSSLHSYPTNYDATTGVLAIG